MEKQVTDRLEELLERAKRRGEESWELVALEAAICSPKAHSASQVYSGRIQDISEYTEERQRQVSELIIRAARTWLRASRLGHPEAERHLRVYAASGPGQY